MLADGEEKPRYHVVTVEKIATPEGMPGNNWHRYVIRRNSSDIEGMKPGTLNSVTAHAETVAENLNMRSGGANNTAYASRKRT